MSELNPAPREIRLPPALHLELVHRAHAVALKRSELDNAQLRQELAVRRAVEAFGVAGEKVTFDLDAGVVRIGRTASAGASE